MLVAVDESLGRILDALAKKGALDDTVILLTGDNGYFYGEHGLSEERRLAYEESIRLPLLVRYPRLVKAGSKPAQIALTIDLAPTLLELGGAAPEHPLDGRSLVPVLRGGAPDWRTSFLVEYWSDTVFPRIERMGYDAVRTRALQVHPLPGAPGDGRALRPGEGSVRAREPRSTPPATRPSGKRSARSCGVFYRGPGDGSGDRRSRPGSRRPRRRP